MGPSLQRPEIDHPESSDERRSRVGGSMNRLDDCHSVHANRFDRHPAWLSTCSHKNAYRWQQFAYKRMEGSK